FDVSGKEVQEGLKGYIYTERGVWRPGDSLYVSLPDAWVDEDKTKIGYEISLNRYFYKYTPPRPLEEIEADLKKIEQEIADMLAEMRL
ncbi:MAG: hypothetical protein WAO25_08390, partial [Bacillota bacterium]